MCFGIGDASSGALCLLALLTVVDLYGLFRTCAIPVCRYPLVAFHLSLCICFGNMCLTTSAWARQGWMDWERISAFVGVTKEFSHHWES